MERFLEMHMYITSALQKTDMKAVGLQLALDLLHEKVIIFELLLFFDAFKNCSILGKKRFNNRLKNTNKRRET